MAQPDAFSPIVPQSRVEPLLCALGLHDSLAGKARLDQQAIERFARRELAFEWVHMGTSHARVGQLVDLLRERLELVPPRTGHIGNWADMVEGRAGPRDYNHLTCAGRQIGYPLLYDFNQTEGDVPGVGDWSYLPGSLVRNGVRRALELFTWDGDTFRRRDRSEALFTPFTLTRIQGQLQPVARLHRDRCSRLTGFSFRYLSTLLIRNQNLVRALLYVLLDFARRQDPPELFLRYLFDRSVLLSGQVRRQALEVSGRGFRLGSLTYSCSEDVIDHALMPLRLADRPEDLVEQASSLPREMPMPSISLFHMFMAVLNAHYPDTQLVAAPMTRPCNPHLHWGGIPMAGFPPQTHGFFRGKAGNLRKLLRPVVAEVAAIDPVLFVLLPAGIFNLCPHSAYPGDVECLEALFARVQQETTPLAADPSQMNQHIGAIAAAWQAAVGRKLSTYLVSRFSGLPELAGSLPPPGAGAPVMPAAFLQLSWQQASALMGALSQLTWPTGSTATGQAVA